MEAVVPMPSRKGPVKRFLDKPNHDATIGESLILHGSMVVLSVTIPLVFEGWGIILQRLTRKD